MTIITIALSLTKETEDIADANIAYSNRRSGEDRYSCSISTTVDKICV